MSTSSPVPIHQPGRPSPRTAPDRSPRGGTAVIVVRSILLVVAAVAVMATSNYFAYLIGRKQVTYEELRSQVDRIVQLMDQKRVEEELALTKLKQRHERLEQHASGLSDLTTSTINGKTIVREPEPAERPTAAAPVDDTARLERKPSDSALNATIKHLDTHGVAQQRVSRRQKVPATSLARRKSPAAPPSAEHSGQLATAISATPDVGLAGQ